MSLADILANTATSGHGQPMSDWKNPTVFRRILCSGCAKIVLSLHTARTENPYNPQTYSSASNFHKYHSDTPRHPSDSSQAPPDIPGEHEMPTDINRCQETLPDFLKQHLSVSWGVWRCLLAYVGMLCSTVMLWGYRGNV